MEALMEGLAQAGAPGLYLEVSARNDTALTFYRRLGFRAARVDRPGSVVMVRDLATAVPR
jgi:ribosomal protein S18 acetylase RimI-like enzyme